MINKNKGKLLTSGQSITLWKLLICRYEELETYKIVFKKHEVCTLMQVA